MNDRPQHILLWNKKKTFLSNYYDQFVSLAEALIQTVDLLVLS